MAAPKSSLTILVMMSVTLRCRWDGPVARICPWRRFLSLSAAPMPQAEI
jgi:hypothetical protein